MHKPFDDYLEVVADMRVIVLLFLEVVDLHGDLVNLLLKCVLLLLDVFGKVVLGGQVVVNLFVIMDAPLTFSLKNS